MCSLPFPTIKCMHPDSRGLTLCTLKPIIALPLKVTRQNLNWFNERHECLPKDASSQKCPPRDFDTTIRVGRLKYMDWAIIIIINYHSSLSSSSEFKNKPKSAQKVGT